MNSINNITKSINMINYLLFISLIYVNGFFYFFEKLSKYRTLYLFINLFVLFIFFFLNRRFNNEFNEKKKDIKKFNDSLLSWNNEELKNLLLKKIFYKENEDTYKLFKNIYIKKNLLTKDYQDLKTIFLKFIPENFMKEVWEMWTEKISLWVSVKKHLNIMFLDIIWFSTITEKMEPSKALLLLNIYFDWIVEIINNNWWYIDKFLWDWMMIIFDDNISDLSIKSSIEIQNFISKFQVSEVWKKIKVWIWINSWEVILWTIWSRNRMEITIIWDTVNTASRIEWLTREYTDKIIISEATYNIIKDISKFTIKEIGERELRWKSNKIKLFSVEPILNLNL